MTVVTQNLGLVKALEVGSTAPTNTAMLWYDTTVSLHKYYDTNTSAWITFTANINSFISVANKAAAEALIAAEALLEGFYYKIGNLPGDGDSVILKALSSTEFGRVGYGVFKLPDIGGSGDYSGVVAVTSEPAGSPFGIWNAPVEGFVGTGDIVIWNGFHYQCSEAANQNGTNPYVRTTAYTLLPKTAENVGYITEIHDIHFNFDTEELYYRKDKNGNIVENSSCTYPNVANDHCFQWGNQNHSNNHITPNAKVYMANFRGQFYNNELLVGDVTIQELATGEIHHNLIACNTLTFANESGDFSLNTILSISESFNDIPLSESFNNFYKDGKTSTFEMALDLTTYSGGTDIGSINPGLAKLIGKWRLTGANGSTFDSMDADYTSCKHPIEFVVEPGNTQTFSPQAIGGTPTFYSLIGSAGNKIITGRANGQDSILIRANDSYFEIYQVNIIG